VDDARSKWVARFSLVLLYGSIGAIIMGRVFLHPETRVLGGYGDTQQFMWYLGWFWHAVMHGQNVFYTHQINAPLGQNLMWNTSILAESALFGWLVPFISPSVLYNELWLLNFIVACMLGKSILQEVGIREISAMIGGLLMGIMPYQSSQMLFHLHLWVTSILFAIILVLIKQYKNRGVTWRSGGLLGLLAALEFYTSLETCVTFALVLVLYWVIVSLIQKSPLVIGNWISFGSALFIGVVLCLPGLYALFLMPGRPHGTLLPLGVYVNDLLTFFIPTPVYEFHASWMNEISSTYTGNIWENDGYIGLPAGLLVLIGVWHLRRNRFIVASFITLVIIAILSLGPTLHVHGVVTVFRLPWSLVQQIPFLRDIIPSRLMLYGDILIIIIMMFAWHNIRFYAASRIKWTWFLLVYCTVLSWIPAIPYYSSHKATGEEVILRHPNMMQDLRNQAVFVLTSDQSIFMQMMADSGYTLAMVDPYGYADNSGDRDMIRAIRTPFSMSIASAIQLAQQIAKSGATRILYFPVRPEDEIPPGWYQVLNQQYGGPQIQADHIVIWNVK
jgi:hypothetical protein